MDFFGILFDMKNGSKVPYSKTYFDTLFAAKLAEMQIKTLTGTLPLTFRTSETALRSWTIYGNDNVGKNKLEITADTATVKGVTFTVDAANGTITTSGDSTSSSSNDSQFNFQGDDRKPLSDGVLSDGMIFSCDGIGVGKRCCVAYYTANNTYIAEQPVSGGGTIISIPENADKYRFYVRKTQAADGEDVTFKPMLRLPDTSADFEPYQQGVGQRTRNLFPSAAAETKTNGNLSVTCDGNGGYTINKTGALSEETVVTFDIPEFTTPISQGRGGSGIIALFNTKMTTGFQIWFYYDDTYIAYFSLSTAPNRVISNYEALSGVTINRIGFRTSSTASVSTVTGTLTPMTVDDGIAPTDFILHGYEIPLTISQAGQTTKNYDIFVGSEPLTEGQSVSDTQTIEVFEGENTIDTILYNKHEMSITYKGG